MNSSCDMYQPTQPQPPFPYEQQMPSTSYSGGYSAPPGSPYPYRGQAPNYFQPNYSMRVPYPQGQQTANNQILQPEMKFNFPIRPPTDKKMRATHEWMNNHRFMNVAQEQCRTGTASLSVISRVTQMSVATDVSVSSVQSLLSVVQRLEDLRLPNARAPSSSSSCVENIDPNRKVEYEQTVTACLDDICKVVQESILNNDKGALRTAIESLFTITKNSDFNAASESSLEKLMRTLVDLIAKLNPQKFGAPGRSESAELRPIMDRTLSSISRMLAFEKVKRLMNKWDVKTLVAMFVRWMVPTEKFCFFVLTTVHSLMEMVDPRKFEKEVKEAIVSRLVDVMGMIYQHESRYFINTAKQKQYIFVLIRAVCHNDDGLKKFFMSKNGMELLLRLLVKETDRLLNLKEKDESAIYRIIYLLYALVMTSDKTFGEQLNKFRYGDRGGLEVLAKVAEKLAQSYRVVEYSLLSLRAVSDIEDVRSSDNGSTICCVEMVLQHYGRLILNLDRSTEVIGREDVENFRSYSYIIVIAIGFLGNIAANFRDNSGRDVRNQNKDYIVERGCLIPSLVILLDFYKNARSRWRDVKEVENLITEIVWTLKHLTGACSTNERTIKASLDLVRIAGAAELLLQELAGTSALQFRFDILNILIRIVEADPLNHPQLLRDASLRNNNSCWLANILLDIIAEITNIKEPRRLGKQIVVKAYSLLLLLANSNLSFGHEIRCICGGYQMADFVWPASEDSDLIKYALEFISFVAKDETFRDHLSKDMELVNTVRNVAEQVNENSSSAQQLLFALSCNEAMIPFETMTML